MLNERNSAINNSTINQTMSSFTTASVSTIVGKLPREISLYIYTEFLETECKYEIIMREFRSERVQRLNSEELCKLMNRHFEDTQVISYLRKREELFDYYYRKIMIHNNGGFIRLSKINSTTNSWVMGTYH